MQKRRVKKNQNTNSIYAIRPYFARGQWQFDDPSRNLYGEALIAGIPEIIQMVCAEKGITKPETGFSVLFSSQPFPGGDTVLEYVRSEYGGNWYKLRGLNIEGWLCPSLYKFFKETPQNIYLQVSEC